MLPSRLELVRKRDLRKGNREGASFTKVTCSIDTSTEGSGNCLNQAQSKTGTLLCPTIITPVKSFKDMGEILLRYADTSIAHCDCNLPVIRFERNLHSPLRWSELQGIIEEIGNYSLKLSSLSID
jgi:hypothetical protein